MPPLPVTLDIQNRAAIDTPANFPKAAATYRYGPPVVVKRLPAAAKHRTIGANKAAPRM